MKIAEKISATQLIALIVINRLMIGFTILPTATMVPANQDAWIVEIISSLLLVIIAIPMLVMANKFQDMSFAEYFEIILGKPIGKIICFVFVLFLLFMTLISATYLSDFLLSSIYPETPLYAILLFMIIPCIYATYKGLECIGRTAILTGIFIFFIIIFYVILNANNMDLKMFLPILHDSKLSQIAYGAFINANRFSDLILFFMFIPHVRKTKNFSITKTFITLVSIFTLLNILIVISTQASLGIEFAKILRYPYFITIQQISLFNIIERIELFNVVGWIFIFFYKISSTVLVASFILKQIFNTKSYKQFVIPFNIIIFAIALMTSISYYPVFKKIITDYVHMVIFAANFIIPTIVFAVYYFRRKTL